MCRSRKGRTSPPGKNLNGYSVDCGTKWQQLFTFDAFGNITKTGNSTFTPTYSTAKNQFTISGVPVAYDANGNLLTDNLNNTYTWDPNWGNLASINSTNLIYDALGQMVEQQNGTTYTQMLYSQIGKTAIMNGQTLSKAFVALPAGETAIYNSTGLAYYRHADWLGSSRLTSTAARGVYSDSAYAPFGEQYAVTGTADASFTGQNADTTPTLYDFTFREYSPSQGRWISPDPAGLAAANPGNPQSWNRYAYVLNNPLALTDLLGLDCVYDNEDGTVSVGYGDCDNSTYNGNGYYVDCDGCLFDGQGNPTTFTLNADGSLDFVYATGVGVGTILGFADPVSANSSMMIVNGNYVFPTTVDKYNLMEKGKTNLRDFNFTCSTHVTIDQSTGQVQSHVDLFNPQPLPIPFVSPAVPVGLHLIYDVIPDAIYRTTGMYLVPAGRSACQ